MEKNPGLAAVLSFFFTGLIGPVGPGSGLAIIHLSASNLLNSIVPQCKKPLQIFPLQSFQEFC